MPIFLNYPILLTVLLLTSLLIYLQSRVYCIIVYTASVFPVEALSDTDVLSGGLFRRGAFSLFQFWRFWW